jgi:hypothetical protein
MRVSASRYGSGGRRPERRLGARLASSRRLRSAIGSLPRTCKRVSAAGFHDILPGREEAGPAPGRRGPTSAAGLARNIPSHRPPPAMTAFKASTLVPAIRARTSPAPRTRPAPTRNYQNHADALLCAPAQMEPILTEAEMKSAGCRVPHEMNRGVVAGTLSRAARRIPRRPRAVSEVRAKARSQHDLPDRRSGEAAPPQHRALIDPRIARHIVVVGFVLMGDPAGASRE